MNPLSIDLRRRIVERYQRGNVTYAKVASLFDVGEATVSRLLRRSRERETLHPDPNGGGFPPRISNEQLSLLVALVAEKPDRTILELCEQWTSRYGTTLSWASMQRALQRAGLTRKKRPSPRASSSVRTSKSNARNSFAKWRR